MLISVGYSIVQAAYVSKSGTARTQI